MSYVEEFDQFKTLIFLNGPLRNGFGLGLRSQQLSDLALRLAELLSFYDQLEIELGLPEIELSLL